MSSDILGSRSSGRFLLGRIAETPLSRSSRRLQDRLDGLIRPACSRTWLSAPMPPGGAASLKIRFDGRRFRPAGRATGPDGTGRDGLRPFSRTRVRAGLLGAPRSVGRRFTVTPSEMPRSVLSLLAVGRSCPGRVSPYESATYVLFSRVPSGTCRARLPPPDRTGRGAVFSGRVLRADGARRPRGAWRIECTTRSES